MNGLPAGWTSATVEELAAPEPNAITDGPFGSNLKTEHYTTSGPRVIRLQNIGDGSFIDAKAHITESHYRSLLKHRVDAGDIVIAVLGERLPRACVVPPSLGPAIVKADCVRFRPDTRVADPKFLTFMLNADPTRSQVMSIVHGVGRPRLNLGEIKAISLPVPPLAEQHRVVAEIEKQFTRLDAAVAALQRVHANLKRYRTAVLKAACEGRLVPTEAEIARTQGRLYEPAQRFLTTAANVLFAGDVPSATVSPLANYATTPEGWAWTRLSAISRLKGGITKDAKRRVGGRPVPYLRVANVQRGYLDLTEVKHIEATEAEIAELRLHPGDVLFNEGGDRDKLGRGWVWNGELTECIHQNHVFRARLTVPQIDPRFISWYANTMAKLYFVGEGKQSTNLASISLSKLGALPVPVPPVAEQQRIVAEVERRLSIIHQLELTVEAGLKRAARMRQSILKYAFEGKVVPQERTDEPASAVLERIRTERSPEAMRRRHAGSANGRAGQVGGPRGRVDRTAAEGQGRLAGF